MLTKPSNLIQPVVFSFPFSTQSRQVPFLNRTSECTLHGTRTTFGRRRDLRTEIHIHVCRNLLRLFRDFAHQLNTSYKLSTYSEPMHFHRKNNYLQCSPARHVYTSYNYDSNDISKFQVVKTNAAYMLYKDHLVTESLSVRGHSRIKEWFGN